MAINKVRLLKMEHTKNCSIKMECIKLYGMHKLVGSCRIKRKMKKWNVQMNHRLPKTVYIPP